MSSINLHDWKAILHRLRSTSPHNYAVIYEFLNRDAAHCLQRDILRNSGWVRRTILRRFNGSTGESVQQFNANPQSEVLGEIVECMVRQFGVEELSLRNCWAIACDTNEVLFPHCDGGDLSLNLWLSPDDNNASREGGMRFFDVKRTSEMTALEYASAKGGCVEFVERNSNRNSVSVEYAFNRAVLFDAWTFHSTDISSFHGVAGGFSRINLTFTFDVRRELLCSQ